MRAKADVKLHNRFDIEVRDAVTGELKQTAQAENIVLDQMWTRLCGGSTYFVNIHFGTGSGTLSPSRTSLFTHLGTKAAADEELVKAIPNSSWKRKIVLNPEEYVGYTLSEVGIAYGSTSSYLVTHAMLEDSEGNPITITKTDTDVITIYATVFVTFGIQTDDISFLLMPNSNTLVNYLIGGGSAPSEKFYVSQDDSNISSTNTQTYPALGETTTASWSSEVANKRRKTGTMRFGTTVGNGHIRSLTFGNCFKLLLPSSGIFTGQEYVNVPIGTGDGVTKTFTLPSKNIRAGTISIKEDTVSNTQVAFTNVRRINHAIYVPSIAGAGVDCTPSGEVLIVGNNAPPYISWFKRVDGGYIRGAAISSTLGGCNGVSVSPDGVYFVATHGGGEKINWFKRDGDTFTKLNAPSTMPQYGFMTPSWCPNGIHLIMTNNSNTNYIELYKCENNTLTRVVAVSTGSTAATSYSWDPSGTFVITQQGGYRLVYKRVDDTLTAVTFPSSPANFLLSSATWSSDGQYILMSSYGSEKFWLVKRTDDTFVSLGVFSSLNYIEPIAVCWTPDQTKIAVVSTTAPYLHILHFESESISLHHSGAGFSTGLGGPIRVTPDGNYILSKSANSPIIDYKARTVEVTFDTAPAAGVAITADYTVDGVHKTDQYVIDVGFSIQFGEPA